ncbi:MAG: phospholipase D-like domain-containing protein [Burkholderiaceae bacterium]
MTQPSGDTHDYWRGERADRLAVIIDAAPFFLAAKQAMLQAQHSILLLGWDFDARVKLEPLEKTIEGPNRIGPFLNFLSKRNQDLEIKILKWDVGAVSSIARGETPFFMFQWMFGNRVKLRLDHAHPPLAAHHTKLIVIDDCIAFCGGIDMTMGRWDTPEHADDEPGRKTVLGKALPPWHDATTCLTGPAASALGDLARMRWRLATGENLERPVPAAEIWPQSLTPQFERVNVKVARTWAAYEDTPQVSEIEKATIKIIRQARSSLYIESQYFASRLIAGEIAKRLQEPDGPEIVVINPETASGWLEEKTMDSARVILRELVSKADRHDRFRLLYPVNAQGTSIYVHAKIMIADDTVLKIGSSNLNNRSMGFDSECDLIIDGVSECERTAIRSIKARLLAEHLGRTEEDVQAHLDQSDSIIRALSAMSREGRGLHEVPQRELGDVDRQLASTKMTDPERPPSFVDAVKSVFTRAKPSLSS